MKQLTILLLMIVALCGCSKDEDKQSTEQSIVGTWWHYESYTPDSDDTYDYRGENRLLVFEANGDYERYEDDSLNSWGTYKLSGNKIILYNADGKVNDMLDLQINKLDKDYLEIDWTYLSGDTRDTWIFRCKRKL